MDAFARMNNYEDTPFHYHMRTRQTCNIVYTDDDFRTTKKTDENDDEIERLKTRSFQKIIDDNSLGLTKELSSKKLIKEMIELVDESAEILGTKKEIAYINTILEKGTSADRQLNMYKKTKDLHKVVEMLSKETLEHC